MEEQLTQKAFYDFFSNNMKAWFSVILCLFLTSCDGQKGKPYTTNQFKQYWYAGQAEINSYKLSQSRYGEQREGTAVLVFVTEDFSRAKQVKLDNPDKAADDKVKVLKLNFMKQFITGIYPYSMMQSVFTPVIRHQDEHTLKTTMTTQEWCGQVFVQMNYSKDRYDIKSHSYFEQEGDQTYKIEGTLLEDELWNIIRLDHHALPDGNFTIIPALFHSRLNHLDTKTYQAVGTKSLSNDTAVYSLEIPEIKRRLTIRYENSFPYRILSWEEEFEERGVIRKTSATLDKTLISDYWTKNKNEFQYLRDSLNLPTH